MYANRVTQGYSIVMSSGQPAAGVRKDSLQPSSLKDLTPLQALRLGPYGSGTVMSAAEDSSEGHQTSEDQQGSELNGSNYVGATTFTPGRGIGRSPTDVDDYASRYRQRRQVPDASGLNEGTESSKDGLPVPPPLSRKSKSRTTIRRHDGVKMRMAAAAADSNVGSSTNSLDSVASTNSTAPWNAVRRGNDEEDKRVVTNHDIADGVTPTCVDKAVTTINLHHHHHHHPYHHDGSHNQDEQLTDGAVRSHLPVGISDDSSSTTDDGGSSTRPPSLTSLFLNDVDESVEGPMVVNELAATANEDKLHHIVEELVTTEERYVTRLYVLVMVKYECSVTLSPEIAKSMFQNIEVIHQFHKENLLPKLRQRLAEWPQIKKLGDIMVNCGPFLKLYTDYVTNRNTGSQLVETWVEKNKRFASLVNEIKENPKYGRLTLQAHMLEPIQRVPRYALLLREYLKKLPQDSEDKTSVTKALEVISDVASHFEVMLQRDENMSQLIQIQKQLLGFRLNIVSHDRYLVRRGQVTTVNIAGKRTERYAFLFNDMLMVCIERPVMSKYQMKQQLMLKQAKVTSGDNPIVQHTLAVRCHDKTVELAFNCAEEKNQWQEDILKQIKELSKKRLQRQFDADEPEVRTTRYAAYSLGHTLPVLVAKDDVNNCHQCRKEFIKETNKHYCRACGNVYCSKCASHSVTLQYAREVPRRVCDACFLQLSENESSLQSPPVPTVLDELPTQTTYRDDVMEQDYLYISADSGATWVQRWFVVYETGVLSTYKTNQDVTPLASMSLSSRGFVVQMVSVDLPAQSRAIHLASKDKSYYLYSEQWATMERWFDALSHVSYQLLSRPTAV